jgi:hypothetical protein
VERQELVYSKIHEKARMFHDLFLTKDCSYVEAFKLLLTCGKCISCLNLLEELESSLRDADICVRVGVEGGISLGDERGLGSMS